MSEREPTSAQTIAGEPTTALPWSEARDRLARGQFYWLATTGDDGTPHLRPVLAVWTDGNMYTTSSPASRKSANLARDGQVSISLTTDGLDVVLEGTGTRITDDGELQRVADTYKAKYGWPPTVRDGAFDAPYGAPTAGPPPYEVFRVEPATVYGFGTDETHAPRSTRWRF